MIKTELHEIHACLRHEADKLNLCANQLCNSSGSAWSKNLDDLVHQFDFFFIVYHSHSQAEDDVILPALVEKGLPCAARDELSREHVGQHESFEQLRILLLHLRGLKRYAADLRSMIEHLVSLTSDIQTSVRLHMKKEEEELYPILTNHFSSEELDRLAGSVLGNRSSDLVKRYIDMIIRDLPDQDRNHALESIKEIAKTTRFSSWLKQVLFCQESNQIFIKQTVDFKGAGLSWNQEGIVLGCKHYKRKCLLLFPCCESLYPCRLCHDEEVLVGSTSMHLANRFEVRQMWCMLCSTLQPTSQTCANCAASMSSYHCSICNLFDEDLKVFHCQYCNVCRRGLGLGIDFFHCMKCNCCISTKISRQHECRDNLLEVDCPICLQNLFDTTVPLHMTQCNHFMHQSCYQNYIRHSFKCPTCRKCVYKMDNVWKRLDAIWEQVNATAGDRSTLTIFCDECNSKSTIQRSNNAPANLADQCPACGTYNTNTQF